MFVGGSTIKQFFKNTFCSQSCHIGNNSFIGTFFKFNFVFGILKVPTKYYRDVHANAEINLISFSYQKI